MPLDICTKQRIKSIKTFLITTLICKLVSFVLSPECDSDEDT